eukprot:scaffold200697_cov16-Tisochrysis_lutea.AAC.1
MNHGIQDELLKIQAAASLKEKECEDLRCQLEQLRRENRQVASVLLPAALAELEVLKKATELNYNASAEEELQAKLNDALAAAESQRQHFCKQQELEASLPCKKLHRKKEKRTLPRKKAYAGLPTPIKEKETYWLRRTHPAPEPGREKLLSSIACLVVTSLLEIRKRMVMKYVSKFNGTLVIKSQLFILVKGMLNIIGPTNTQKDGM